MRRSFFSLFAAVPLLVALSAPQIASSATVAKVPTMSDAQLRASFTTLAGASPLSTDRTIVHFATSTTDPTNAMTYGANYVGVNPTSCAAACDTTVQVDITPVNVVVSGLKFSGSDVVGATLASPQFAPNDYATTPAATAPGSFPNTPAFVRGSGGPLLQTEAGNQLQLQDVTNRAQFNQTGTSSYHLRLQPNVLAPVTIVVPPNQGTVLASGRGVVFGDVDISWWSAQINNLNNSADPTHLPLYLTNNIFLYEGKDPYNCCVLGFHGAKASNTGAKGNQKVQTFAWASWVQPGLFARADGGTDWALQDIHAISHEIAEWADDPFTNNTVQPWLTPTAPQYGCTRLLETGDPVVGIGFAMGTNTFQQGLNPNGTQSADGAYHPEDEALSQWFLRQSPSSAAPTQSPSANIGRYTLMGDLNPFPGFRNPATGC